MFESLAKCSVCVCVCVCVCVWFVCSCAQSVCVALLQWLYVLVVCLGESDPQPLLLPFHRTRSNHQRRLETLIDVLVTHILLPMGHSPQEIIEMLQVDALAIGAVFRRVSVKARVAFLALSSQPSLDAPPHTHRCTAFGHRPMYMY